MTLQPLQDKQSGKKPPGSVEPNVGDLIEGLQEAWGPGQVCHRREPACSGFRVRPRPGSLAERVCLRFDLEGLYAHQDRALSILESGRHLVLATATASGKSLVYMLHMAERVTLRPEARGLFIYPLKALAQDQLHGWQRIAAAVDQPQAGAALYDGDLSAWRRRRLRELPPTVLMTNPEMLHLSLLAHHDKWASFWRNLELVVVDEVHTFRGVFGTHMAQVLRRLRRIG